MAAGQRDLSRAMKRVLYFVQQKFQLHSQSVHSQSVCCTHSGLLRPWFAFLRYHDVHDVLQVVLLFRDRLLQLLQIRFNVVNLALVMLRCIRSALYQMLEKLQK